MKRVLAVGVIAVTASGAFAADYPVKAIRIVSPFPPGGSVDLVARILGADLGKVLGQQIVVDNRSGATGMIGTEMAKNAPPDGYTLLINTLPFVTNQFAYAKTPYDPVNDFAPVSLLASVASVLVSHPALPVTSMKDLIALARAKPNAITYGTAGAGSNPHIAGELLNNLAKSNLALTELETRHTRIEEQLTENQRQGRETADQLVASVKDQANRANLCNCKEQKSPTVI